MDADTVITSIGYESNQSLYKELSKSNANIHLIGDASKVSNLMGAIWGAYEIAINL